MNKFNFNENTIYQLQSQPASCNSYFETYSYCIHKISYLFGICFLLYFFKLSVWYRLVITSLFMRLIFSMQESK
jgi:hypothetical protein